MVKSKQRRQPIVNESSASSSESETGDQAIMSRAKELLSALEIDLSNRLHGYQKLAEEARQRRDVPAPAAAEPDGRQVTLL
jgi:hypothetical protein